MINNQLILLHGAIGSKSELEDLKFILSKDFAVHSFNFEGHGGTPSKNEFSIDLFSNNVINYMSASGLQKAHFFGYSMGGYVALDVALKFPDLVDKMVTFGTKFEWTEESSIKETKKLNATSIQQKVPAFAKYLEELHRPCDWKEILNKTASMIISLGKDKALNQSDFSQIKNDVLVCLGTMDNMVSREESESVVDTLTKGTFHHIDQFYHPLAKNDMAIMASIIMDFLIP